MITLETESIVTYCCKISGEDEEKILTYAKENKCDLLEATKQLYENYEISIYDDSYEIDFNTEEITSAEIEE